MMISFNYILLGFSLIDHHIAPLLDVSEICLDVLYNWLEIVLCRFFFFYLWPVLIKIDKYVYTSMVILSEVVLLLIFHYVVLCRSLILIDVKM